MFVVERLNCNSFTNKCINGSCIGSQKLCSIVLGKAFSFPAKMYLRIFWIFLAPRAKSTCR